MSRDRPAGVRAAPAGPGLAGGASVGNDANHVHPLWRDPLAGRGRDALGDHHVRDLDQGWERPRGSVRGQTVPSYPGLGASAGPTDRSGAARPTAIVNGPAVARLAARPGTAAPRRPAPPASAARPPPCRSAAAAPPRGSAAPPAAIRPRPPRSRPAGTAPTRSPAGG